MSYTEALVSESSRSICSCVAVALPSNKLLLPDAVGRAFSCWTADAAAIVAQSCAKEADEALSSAIVDSEPPSGT